MLFRSWRKNAKVFFRLPGTIFCKSKVGVCAFLKSFKYWNIETCTEIFLLTNSSTRCGTCNSFLLRISNRREFLRCSIMKILKYFMPARIFNFEKNLCISCHLTRPEQEEMESLDMKMWPFSQYLAISQPWHESPMNEHEPLQSWMLIPLN